MFSPVDEVGAFAHIYITERRVGAVARPAEQQVFAVDLSGEKDAVSVEWHKRVRHTDEGLEIFCFAQAY